MDGYWLFKPNSTWPNSGTTYFVESVRVILGGGGTFNYKGDPLYEKSIGTIVCK